MAQLLLQTATGFTVGYPLREHPLVIGRSKACDVVLDGDHGASRRHAEVRCEAGRWQVADQNSTNGTRVNGERIRRARSLVSGDVITIGRYVLVFEEKTAGSIATDRLEMLGTRADSRAGVVIGQSPAMRAVFEQVERLAPSSCTVLVRGENGTGKEGVARLLHDRSARCNGPFEVVNCPALPGSLIEAELFGVEKGVATGVDARTGRLEAAAGGTLFLDEVGDLELGSQAKLLRFLQDRQVQRLGGGRRRPIDVRVVAATNQDLEVLMARGAFRRDLYHRLDVVTLHLPPLRERREDIPQLVAHFLAHGSGPVRSVSAPALAAICARDYPGNVRELENLVRRLRLTAREEVIAAADLPARLGDGARNIAAPAQPAAQPLTVAGQAVPASWSELRQRFLARELGREELRSVIRDAYEKGGHSYRRAAERLGAGEAYKPFLDFLRYHRLRVRDR